MTGLLILEIVFVVLNLIYILLIKLFVNLLLIVPYCVQCSSSKAKLFGLFTYLFVCKMASEMKYNEI